MNNNIDNEENNIFLNKIWRNNYLLSIIRYHILLYKKNYIKTFKSKEELIEYKYRQYISIIVIDYYQDYNSDDIPSSCIEIRFTYNFKKRLESVDIPRGVTTLKFPPMFNYPVSNGFIPPNLTKLIFGELFTQCIKPFDLPNSIKSIEFCKNVFQQIKPINQMDVIPNSCESIKYYPGGWVPIPKSVTELTYSNSNDAKKYIPCSLQSNIKIFKFGNAFNDYIRPNFFQNSSLESLTFGEYFNRPTSLELLPKSLKQLKFGSDFNQPIDFIDQYQLSTSLTCLKFGYSFNQDIQNLNLLKSLKFLSFGSNFKRKIKVGYLPNQSLESISFNTFNSINFEENSIPNSVTQLCIGWNYTDLSFLPKLSKNITCLKFNDNFNKKIKINDLPSTIKQIKFGETFNQYIEPGVFPVSLELLSFGNTFNQELHSNLFEFNQSITNLSFGNKFNKPIDNIFKYLINLKILSFGNEFNQLIENDKLPKSLEKIYGLLNH